MISDFASERTDNTRVKLLEIDSEIDGEPFNAQFYFQKIRNIIAYYSK